MPERNELPPVIGKHRENLGAHHCDAVRFRDIDVISAGKLNPKRYERISFHELANRFWTHNPLLDYRATPPGKNPSSFRALTGC